MYAEQKSDLKVGQRNAKTPSHLEVRIEELEGEVKDARQALHDERQAAKKAEFEGEKAAKEAAWRISQLSEKVHRLEVERDLGKVSINDLKSCLDTEREATESLIREHKLEVKCLRDDVRSKIHYAYKELQEKDKREMEEVRAARLEAEKTYKLLELDFRSALAEKDEELRRFREEASLAQRELKEQLRCKHSLALSKAQSAKSESELVRSLNAEIAALRLQNLEIQKKSQGTVDKAVKLANKQRLSYEKLNEEKDIEARTEISRLRPVNSDRRLSQEQIRKSFQLLKKLLHFTQ